MKTYTELKERLISAGWKDIAKNYFCSGVPTMLHVGYGHNSDSHPRTQIRVYREQYSSHGKLGWQDWMVTDNGARPVPVRSLEQIWAKAMEMGLLELQVVGL